MRINIVGLVGVLAFVSGAGVGVFSTKTYFKKKYEELVQEEIESIREVRNRNAESTEEDQYAGEKPEKGIHVPSREEVDYERNITRYSGGEEEEVRIETLDSEGNPNPYIIEEEEFVTTPDTEYEKDTLYFYTHDEVLIDDQDEVVTTPFMIIGGAAQEYFNKCKHDPNMHNVVYIKNESMNTMYEIIGVEANYGELVAEEEYNIERD